MDRRRFLTGVSALGIGGWLARPRASAASTGDGRPLDAVIVGGGASGLAAAWLLKDYRIRVLEAETETGGRTLGGQWRGFHYDKGTEYIGQPEGAVAEWIDDLGLEALAIPPPTGGVVMDGRLWTGRDILGFLPGTARDDYERIADRLEVLYEGGIGAAVDDGAEGVARIRRWDRQTVAGWLAEESAHPLVRELIDVENRGLFGAANADLSLAWNVPEMAWNLYDPDDAETSGVYSFRRGMQEITAAASRGLGRRVVETGARVERIERTPDRKYPLRIHYRRAGQRVSLAARACVLTVPAPIAAVIAEPVLSGSARRTLASVPYAPYVTVNLMLERRVLHETWSVAAIGEFFVTLYDAVRTQVAADYRGPAVLGVYVAPDRAGDRSLLALSDTALVRRILDGLERYVPGIAGLVLDADIQRFEYAFPVFDRRHTERLLALGNDASLAGPLVLAGDYMVYPTFDGAVESAVKAVERLDDYFG